MRWALLSLLFTLALSDGADYQYGALRATHLLPDNVNTGDMNSWVKHLVNNSLCGYPDLLSFIRQNEENNIRSVCRGAGEHREGNVYMSTTRFQVYMVKSLKPDGQCVIEKCITGSYRVMVACDGGHPVRYERQEEGMQEGPCN